METTAQVLAHYESAYITALRTLTDAEARLNTKGTREARAHNQERKRKATESLRETTTILLGLYKVYNPAGVTNRWEDKERYWSAVLRARMEAEDRAEAERRGAEARENAQPPRGLA